MKGAQHRLGADSAAELIDSQGPTVTDTEALPAPATEIAAGKRYDVLASFLSGCTDTGALFKVAGSPDFRAASATLAPAELKRLRELYVTRKNDLDGRTKLDEFDGQIISITDILFWHTDKYENNGGNGVTLTYTPESDPTRLCRSMTSSSLVYRFATSACDPAPPTASDPVRVLIQLVPVRDPERAAKGQRQWQFRLMPTLTRDNGLEGSPF